MLKSVEESASPVKKEEELKETEKESSTLSKIEPQVTKVIYETKIEKGSKLRQITGEVIAVDIAIETVTVKGKNKVLTIRCLDGAGWHEGNNISNIKVGDKIVVRYVENENENICKRIFVKN